LINHGINFWVITPQAEDAFMMHDDAVTTLAVSLDSELLASGGRDGKLKVWRLSTGECLRRACAAEAACLVGDDPIDLGDVGADAADLARRVQGAPGAALKLREAFGWQAWEGRRGGLRG
jgi:hypothetical protein